MNGLRARRASSASSSGSSRTLPYPPRMQTMPSIEVGSPQRRSNRRCASLRGSREVDGLASRKHRVVVDRHESEPPDLVDALVERRSASRLNAAGATTVMREPGFSARALSIEKPRHLIGNRTMCVGAEDLSKRLRLRRASDHRRAEEPFLRAPLPLPVRPRRARTATCRFNRMHQRFERGRLGVVVGAANQGRRRTRLQSPGTVPPPARRRRSRWPSSRDRRSGSRPRSPVPHAGDRRRRGARASPAVLHRARYGKICAVMIVATSACTAARNGTNSTARSRSGGCSMSGNSRCESASSPCPGNACRRPPAALGLQRVDNHRAQPAHLAGFLRQRGGHRSRDFSRW